ncbi:transposable element Tc3 transposase [Trichonephila clavipes]|nr:transposable element Tc3 transposase [Trichonephila clavipes]
MANNQSVRRHLDSFTRGRIIGNLEEGRSVTSVAAEFGIAHSIVSRLWRQFQTTGTAIRGFSSGRPRGTTPADDRYIVLQARRNRWQTAGEIARHTTQATGRPISRFTVARRLHDESRFSLSSDSHRILIWRERGSRNQPSNIIERDRYGGRGVLVWGGIMLGSRTDLHIFDAGSVNGTRYCNEILLPYMRLLEALWVCSSFHGRQCTMSSHSSCRTALRERLSARTLPPVTIRELRLALSSCVTEQFHSDASLETVDRRAPNNSKNWQWTTEGDVSARCLIPPPHGGEWLYSFLQEIDSTLVYCYRCTNVAFVNSSTSAAPWIPFKSPFIQDPLTLSHRRLHESCFNLWDNDGHIRVRHYGGERCLPECIIERHSSPTNGVMVWVAISYHGRSNLLRIEAQHMQLLPWPAYSSDMLPIEQVRELVGWRLIRDPRPAASKDEILLRI